MTRYLILAVVILTLAARGGGPIPSAVPTSSGRIAFMSGFTLGEDIFVMNGDGTDLVNLTNSPDQEILPIWSPDGKRIAFLSKPDRFWEIYVMNAEGSGQTRLTFNTAHDMDPDWSP